MICLLAVLWVGVCLLTGCESVDTATGTTSENDFTLTLEVVDQFVHVGDQATLILRFKRTDGSNLSRGMQGSIVITTSIHGSVDARKVVINVPDDTTTEFVTNVVFTADLPGVAEVRASFLDATALVKVLISHLDT